VGKRLDGRTGPSHQSGFRFYLQQEGSESFTAQDVEAEMSRRMRSRKFLNDMDGYLPPNASYDPVAAYDEFRKVFMPHL
jgi:hypothetical protein